MSELLTVNRITRAIGAEISGVDFRSAVGDPAIADQLHAALTEHQVLFARGADLSPTDLADLGRSLGALGARHHSYTTHAECDDVVVLDWHGDMLPDAAEWHADMTYKPVGPRDS